MKNAHSIKTLCNSLNFSFYNIICKYFFYLIVSGFLSCNNHIEDLTKYVDPMIGTSAHGHTFPGATTPFGMVQLSPDTGTEGWDWCSGYHYSDSSIIGFSHTHLSGTGGADLGDILIMPFVGEYKWEAGSKENPDEGYRSRFSHKNETARAGYYSVFLDDYKILAELTATPRVGIHKYSYQPTTTTPSIIIDLEHGISDQPKECFIRINNKNEIVGMRRSQGWASDQYVYFAARFSKPIKYHCLMADGKILGDLDSAKGKSVKLIIDFANEPDTELVLKVAISSVDVDGAVKNLNTEAKHNNFETYLTKSSGSWNKSLNKIIVNSGNTHQKRIFYSALYHTQIAPNLFTDVDGRYRGMDGKIHNTNNTFSVYTIFSLWDTFRATHPLYTIIEPDKNKDFINTMLIHYKQHGLLPVWELMANETGTMIGYHSIPVIWDAYQKGERRFDSALAFDAMIKSAMTDQSGLKHYKSLGFIPKERETNSVSKTVEYAYDDWCIAQMAKELGKIDEYNKYIERAQNYRNVFDVSTGFLRGREANGNWREPFDPIDSSILGSGDFTEGNSWHYTFFAPHDITGLVNLFGGKEKLATKIDEMFDQEPIVTNDHAPDISGLLGQYAHGNEPSHHVAYLYNYTGKPWKTQEKVAQIMDSLYTDKPDGLSGNEDCGQLSAWYIFSAMGFYPVTPGSGQYIIGSPLFEKTTINVGNNKTFTIKTSGRSKDAIYIQSAQLNGKNFNKSFITHQEILKGGELVFEMGNKPNEKWGSDTQSIPDGKGIPDDYRSRPIEDKQVFTPYFDVQQTLFNSKKNIEIKCNTPGAQIYYSLNGNEPTTNEYLYTTPVEILNTTQIKARAIKSGLAPSETISTEFIRAKIKNNNYGFPSITYLIPPSKSYNRAGNNGLIDGKRGRPDFHDNKWLGFNGKIEAIIDLGEPVQIGNIRLSFLRNIGSWILFPEKIEIFASNDKVNYILIGSSHNKILQEDYEIKIHEFVYPVNDKFRFFKVNALSVHVLPDWHPGSGNRPWLFADEFIFEY